MGRILDLANSATGKALYAPFAAVGALVAWYWLTRPPERLALRILDRGSQIHIEWTPVQNGDSGNLEITDGCTHFSISLSPDQLRYGMFIYRRQSESVTVRLEAALLRRGARPLVKPQISWGKKIRHRNRARSRYPYQRYSDLSRCSLLSRLSPPTIQPT